MYFSTWCRSLVLLVSLSPLALGQGNLETMPSIGRSTAPGLVNITTFTSPLLNSPSHASPSSANSTTSATGNSTMTGGSSTTPLSGSSPTSAPTSSGSSSASASLSSSSTSASSGGISRLAGINWEAGVAAAIVGGLAGLVM